MRFITKGKGPNRRVIPIEERRMPERWRETGVVAASKRMRIPEIERRAEMLASDESHLFPLLASCSLLTFPTTAP